MSAEHNADVAVRFLKSMATGTDWSLACDDMRFWVPGRPTMNRAEFETMVAKVYAVLQTKVAVDIRYVTAQDDRVAIEFDGHALLPDGTAYDNTYHFLYIMRDGKVAEQREHANSAYAQRVLGPVISQVIGEE